ncbi:hypothetical protein N9057_07215, partial [Akkermansiaceae bacterium]|nr:hypothetical protein [Akkermansiaceae bacterium]
PVTEGFLGEPNLSDEDPLEPAVTIETKPNDASTNPGDPDGEEATSVAEFEALEDKEVESEDEALDSEDEEVESEDEEVESEDEALDSEDEEVDSEDEGLESKDEVIESEGEEVEVKDDHSGESILDDIELTLDEESAFESDDAELDGPSQETKTDKSKPIVPDPDEVAELVAKKLKSANPIEVLGPQREELSVPEEKVSKWAFWKRPSKRDQQLARISEGYFEMIDLVRAIRGQLESQNENNVILRETLSHLPQAMKGFDQGLHRFSKSQQLVGKALGEIHTQMKTYNDKDERLAVSMDGFNDTLKGMDDTSKATMKTFDRVQERMRDSDIRMENLFQNVQNTEEKVSDTMVRLQRNMAVMQYIFLGCLMVVIGVLVFTVIKNNDEPNTPRQSERVDSKPDTETN